MAKHTLKLLPKEMHDELNAVYRKEQSDLRPELVAESLLILNRALAEYVRTMHPEERQRLKDLGLAVE